MLGRAQRNTDSIGSIPKYFRQDEPMIGLKTALGGNPFRVDRTGDASRTRVSVKFDFDFIECFTTTFLRAHSWLNRVDEDDDEHDEVGLKEKPEDTRYIKKITSK